MSDNIVHVFPVFPDEREHVTDGGPDACWCEPELSYRDPDTDGEVWTHRRVQ